MKSGLLLSSRCYRSEWRGRAGQPWVRRGRRRQGARAGAAVDAFRGEC